MMRTLLLILITAFLSACVCHMNPLKDPTINSWRGAKACALVDEWGQPDEIVQTRKGSDYIYHRYASDSVPPATTCRRVCYSNVKCMNSGTSLYNNYPCTTIFHINKHMEVASSEHSCPTACESQHRVYKR